MATLKEELRGLVKKFEDEENEWKVKRVGVLGEYAQLIFNKLIVDMPDSLRRVAAKGAKSAVTFCSISSNYVNAKAAVASEVFKQYEESLVISVLSSLETGKGAQRTTQQRSFVFKEDEIFRAVAFKFRDWCNAEGFTFELLDKYNVGGVMTLAAKVTFAD